MGYFDWTEDLGVGIAGMDDEHRRLVELLNTLGVAMRGKSRREVLKAMVHAFVEQARAHIANEEREMGEHGYAELDSHRAEHERFSVELSALERRTSEAGFAVKTETVDHLKAWLCAHFKGADGLYRKCLEAH